MKGEQRICGLQTLADLWGKLYLFHPNIIRADKPVDWHTALEKVILPAEQPQTSGSLLVALNQTLLKSLHDPEACAFKVPDSSQVEAWWKRYNESLSDSNEFFKRRIIPRTTITPGITYLNAAHATLRGNPTDTLAARYLYNALQPQNTNDTLIIDLRVQDERYDIFAQLFVLRCFSPQFSLGSSANRMHKSWNEDIKSMQWQGQRWQVQPMQAKRRHLWGERVLTEFARKAFKSYSSPVVILVNRATLASLRYYCAMAEANTSLAMVLDTSDYPSLTPVLINAASTVYSTDSIGIMAFTDILHVRGHEYGYSAFANSGNTNINQNPQGLADLARSALQNKLQSRNTVFSLDIGGTITDTVPKQGTPVSLSREARLRGLIKVWTIIKYLYPHLKTANVNWDSALVQFIPRVEAARTTQEYYLVMQEFGALLKDSHTFTILPLNSRGITVSRPLPPKSEDMPLYFPSFSLERREDKVLIKTRSRLLPDSVLLRVGDELVSIDGQSIKSFEQEWFPRFPAATTQALWRSLHANLNMILRLKGIEQRVTLGIKRNNGTIDSVIVPLHTREQQQSLYYELTAPKPDSVLFKRLSSDICYLRVFDVPRAKETMMDSLIQVWEQSTKAMVLDLRGYPQLNYRSLLSKLIIKTASGPLYFVPMIQSQQLFSNAFFSASEDRTTVTTQAEVEPHTSIRYSKPIVALIDESLISQAEDFCFYLKNSRRCTFVGGATTGTDGTIAYIPLPGGGQFSFTGEEVRYPDNMPFQRIGIQPDITVTKTVRGFQENRDEILEQGIETLSSILTPLKQEKTRHQKRR